MMQLVQDGTIRLDDQVANHLPEVRGLKWKIAGDTLDITFRELGSHKGGLAKEPELPNAAAGPIDGWEPK